MLKALTPQKYKDEPWLMDMIFDAGVEIAPDFLKRYPDLAATLAVNRKLLVDVHGNQEYYVYSMQLMDPNYSGTLPQVWGDSDYRALEINCPVDVHVFDSNGKMVAGIENDEPLSLDDEDSVIASIDENGQKVVYLPVSGEYDVKVQAREDCSVSCGSIATAPQKMFNKNSIMASIVNIIYIYLVLMAWQ